MNKTFKTGIVLAFLMAADVNTASAQFSLKKLAKAATSTATTTTSEQTTDASATTENKINKADFHKYEARKVYVTDNNGNRIKTETGTDDYEIMLFDTTTGEIVDADKAAAQSKAINQAIGAIALKAGVGALLGGVTKDGGGALAGLAAGLGLSISDIKTIISLKKDINKQNKVMEAFKKCINEEGKLVDAELSKEDKKLLGDLDKNSCEMTSDKLNEAKAAAKTAETSNGSIDALNEAFGKLS